MKNLLLAGIIMLAGCCTLNEDYVRQDRKDFDTMTPLVLEMLDDTELYSDAKVQDIKDRLNGKETRISAAEGLLKKED